MLFHHAHVVDGHAAVHGLAHVVDGEQGHLHGGEGFHLDAGLAYGFDGCSAIYAASARLGCASSFEFDSNAGQRQRVAQGNQVAGFFGALNAGDAGNAQHVAFFGVARFDQRQCGGQHLDASASDGDAVGGRFGGNVDHVGLALGVKVGKCRHGGGRVGADGCAGACKAGETLKGHGIIRRCFIPSFRYF